MARFRLLFMPCLVLLLLLLSLTTAQAAAAPLPAQAPEVIVTLPRGAGPGEVGIQPPLTERDPLGPQALRVAPDGALFLLDTLNHRVLRYDQGKHSFTETPVPEAGQMADLALRGDRFYVMDNSRAEVRALDANGKVQETYPATREMRAYTSGIAVNARGQVFWQTSNEAEYEMQPQSALPSPHAPYPAAPAATLSLGSGEQNRVTRFDRQDDRRGLVRVLTLDRTPVLALPVETAHALGSALLLGDDRAGNHYVLVQEILENVPAFLVETTVRRYTRTGAPDGVAHVPLEGVYFVPTRFVDVAFDGSVYFLQVRETEAQILRLKFQPEFASQLAARWEALQPRLPRSTPRSRAPSNANAYLTRNQIIQNAAAYVDLQWGASAANLNGTACDNKWVQPTFLNGAAPGPITSMPYQWGGYDSIAQFLNKMASGAAAGDIGLDQIRTCAGGVDCSGFVSRVWNEARYTTYSIDQISYTLNGWQDLSRGDAVNWRAGHVLIFDRFATGGLNTYESAGACGDHACRYFRSFAYLGASEHLYVPIRYNNVEPSVCANAAAVGAGTSRPQMFIDAYVRNGGLDLLGCTTNVAHWWPRSGAPRDVVIQDLSSPTSGASAIIHDEAMDQPPNTVPAFVMRGAIWNWYTGPAAQPFTWLGAPTTDEYITNGTPAQGFVNGRVLWQNGSATVQAWNENQPNWKAEYWNNTALTGGRAYVGSENMPPQYDWGAAAPYDGATGVLSDRFSARWTRTVFLQGGTYRVHMKVDDGGRLFIDNQKVLDAWFDQGPTEYTYDVTFPAGANHSIRFEYYDHTGGAMAMLWWDYADTIPPGGQITGPVDGTVTRNPVLNLTANAWDYESGVNRVEFYALYGNARHLLCTDTTAPYTCVWNAQGIPNESVALTIDVIDNAGNRTVGAGGARTVRILQPRPAYLPLILR